MPLDALRAYFSALAPLPAPALDRLVAGWQEVSFRPRSFITSAGQVEHYLYFVLEGVQRSFCLRDGKEFTLAFTYPPGVSGIPESFLTRTPSPNYLEALTPSRLLRLSRRQLDELLATTPAVEPLFRQLLEQALVGVLHRQAELMTCSMAERFRNFLARSPHLLHTVPHKHLASYLNMDPTNFSKLLNQSAG